MSENLTENIHTLAVEYANTVRLKNPTVSQVVESIEIDADKAREYGNVIRNAEFDDDIRAYALMDHFGINEKSSVKDMERVRDIYHWLKDGSDDVFDIVEKVKKIALRIGNPLDTKLEKVWYYIALDRQGKQARDSRILLEKQEKMTQKKKNELLK